MKVSRRSILAGSAVAAGTTALTGCGRVASIYRRQLGEPYSPPLKPENEKLLDRIGFGWSTSDEKRIEEMGREKYIAAQLRGDLEEPIELITQLQSLDSVRIHPVELMELPRARVVEQLQCAALLRATYSPNQLKEKMVDFWSNHFNIYSGKADGAFFKGNEEEAIIRKHAIGNFRDMAKAMAKSPAMLVYLDNNQNYKGHPNENYARELLELHTLGIDGGYSQKDIQEVARCLTGWTMENRFLRPKGSFRYDDTIHDQGKKTVLGQKIPPNGGIEDGERVLDILLDHPSTGRYLARKMVVLLAGDRFADVEAKVAAEYKSSGGDIAKMLKIILDAPEFGKSSTQIRRPFEYMVAALRRSSAITDAGPDLQRYLRKMGQPMYEWPLPDGYPVDQVSWATNMMPRWQFAHDLAMHRIKNTTVDKNFNEKEQRMLLASQLASPEFQYA